MSFWVYNIYDEISFFKEQEADKRRDNFIKYKMSRRQNKPKRRNKRGK